VNAAAPRAVRPIQRGGVNTVTVIPFTASAK
jgi:hypothetical protein